MTDTSSVAVDIYTYDPHGNSETLTGNPFRYTGRRLDAETGLYYYRARYYSPALGRFLQTDPIGYGDGLNWYAYVGNDPVNGTDPSGEFCIPCLGAVIGGGLNLGAQLIANGGDFGKVDFKQVAVAAAAGAVGVGLGAAVANTVAGLGLTGAAAVTANIAGNAVANAALSTTVTAIVEGPDVTGGQLLDSALVGAATGVAASGLSTVVAPALKGSNLGGAPGELTGVVRATLDGAEQVFANSGDALKELLPPKDKRLEAN